MGSRMYFQHIACTIPSRGISASYKASLVSWLCLSPLYLWTAAGLAGGAFYSASIIRFTRQYQGNVDSPPRRKSLLRKEIEKPWRLR